MVEPGLVKFHYCVESLIIQSEWSQSEVLREQLRRTGTSELNQYEMRRTDLMFRMQTYAGLAFNPVESCSLHTQ